METKIQNNIIVFGGGCFWCLEAVYLELKGIKSVYPGYAGGELLSERPPTYNNVSKGDSGYAEVIKIEYNPAEIKFEELLSVFFATHDATTLNRQGNDIGTQYRSVIYFTTEEQRKVAKIFIEKLKKEDFLQIVTELKSLDKFYLAEDYHINYYHENKDAMYCRVVINPKLNKLKANFQSLLKL